MLMQLFGSMAIIVNYVINKEYISKTFCVNRDKPKKRCNGKCHLMKQLQKENKKEKGPLATLKIQSQVQFLEEMYRFSFIPESTAIVFPDFIISKTTSAITPIFHPPALVYLTCNKIVLQLTYLKQKHNFLKHNSCNILACEYAGELEFNILAF